MTYKQIVKSVPLIRWLYWCKCRYKVLSKNKGKCIEIHEGAFVVNTLLSDYNVFYSNVYVNDSFFGNFVYVDSSTIINHTKIGNFCSIGPGCRIGLFKHPPYYISTFPAFFSLYNQCIKSFADDFYFCEHETVNIGNDVWIGANVLIADGVNIGNGAIVAAGAVVTKDVEPYAIVGGAPAKCIKKRFSEQQIEWLLKLQWWNKNLEWFEKHWRLFNMPEEFFSKL